MSARRNTSNEGATKQKIIDAALVLFAEYGIDGVPVRALTSHAGVNVAAIHYHFGGMEAVAEAVFSELSARINKTRTSKLEDILARAKAKRKKPDVADIVLVFVEPYLDENATTEGQLLAQLILKHRLSPSPMTEQVIKQHFDPMAKQFVAALHAAVPSVPLSQMYWRYMLLVSAVVLSVSNRSASNRLERLSGGEADGSDLNALRNALIEFVIGGIRAPHHAVPAP
ncbi:TetR/AcrR family transcriptional regulator [Ottowia caeni]|uniref:TetR/AcrR family transcriptional regulator n=1 Tax=Ottowia caeni TaxID=2870339 RepID=UPI001E51091E|nr:TetR family transcriptional regulator [Ottowia caeni]